MGMRIRPETISENEKPTDLNAYKRSPKGVAC